MLGRTEPCASTGRIPLPIIANQRGSENDYPRRPAVAHECTREFSGSGRVLNDRKTGYRLEPCSEFGSRSSLALDEGDIVSQGWRAHEVKRSHPVSGCGGGIGKRARGGPNIEQGSGVSVATNRRQIRHRVSTLPLLGAALSATSIVRLVERLVECLQLLSGRASEHRNRVAFGACGTAPISSECRATADPARDRGVHLSTRHNVLFRDARRLMLT